MNNFVRNNMSVKRTVALSAILLCVGAAIPVWSAAADARAVMEGVYQQDQSKDMTIRANLEIVGKDGTGQKKKFVLKRIGGLGDSKTLLTFTDPAETPQCHRPARQTVASGPIGPPPPMPRSMRDPLPPRPPSQ